MEMWGAVGVEGSSGLSMETVGMPAQGFRGQIEGGTEACGDAPTYSIIIRHVRGLGSEPSKVS